MTTLPLMACGASFSSIRPCLSSSQPASREHRKAPRDWRSLGPFSAFVIALFTEMYGFPLTIYLLSGWLQSRFPQVDWYSHDAGHLLEMIFGWRGNPHFRPFHILSSIAAALGTLLAAVENAG
jgi:hypothetical protein